MAKRYIVVKCDPISPGDKVVMIPEATGRLIAVKLNPVSPGDKVVIVPEGTRNIAVKLQSISPGDKVVMIPEGDYRVVTHGIEKVFALDWTHAGSELVTAVAIGAGGVIYYGAITALGFGYLRALNPDRTLKWDCSTFITGHGVTDGQTPDSTPLIDSSGYIYLCAHCFGTVSLQKISPAGVQEWFVYKANGALGSPVLSPDESKVYFPYVDGGNIAIQEVNTSDGSMGWHAHLTGCDVGVTNNHRLIIDSTGVIYYHGKDNLVFGSHGFCFAVNTNGTIKWNIDLGVDNAIIGGAPVLINNEAQILTGDTTLMALNRADGSTFWSVANPGTYLYNTPQLLSDGNIVFTAADKTIYCKSKSSGATVWSHATAEVGWYFMYGAVGILDDCVFAVWRNLYGVKDGVHLYTITGSGTAYGNLDLTVSVWTLFWAKYGVGISAFTPQ